MICDANADPLTEIQNRNYDVCIIGAGVAGIILSLKLAENGKRIALLEGGGLEYSDESQSLYEGENTGLEVGDPEIDRLRYFGGTSGHWAGHTIALDSYDFEPKSYSPESGWPIRKDDVEPYEQEARKWLESGPLLGVGDPFGDVRGDSFKAYRKPVSSSVLEGHEELPTRFGYKYRDAVISHENIDLIYHANAYDLHLEESDRQIDKVKFISLNGDRRGEISADKHIVCMGGIETPRFILNCTEPLHNALGPALDHVGKYFSWHPSVQGGFFMLDWEKIQQQDKPLYEWAALRDESVAYFVPTPEYLEKKQSLNFLMHLNVLPVFDTENLSWKDRLKVTLCATDTSAEIAESLYGKIWQCENARYDGVIYILIEQYPNPDSCISLSDERDRFGFPKAKIDCQLDEKDFNTIRDALLEVGEKFAKHGIGRVKLNDWIAEGDYKALTEPDGISTGALWHAMSTCRMGTSASKSTVDPNLKVFGTNNLYVCGSAVFPTTGHANPTLTIAQLALRLAEHIT